MLSLQRNPKLNSLVQWIRKKASNNSATARNDYVIAETHCDTNFDLKKGNFSWTINNYSVCKKRKENLKSIPFSATDDDFKWHLELSIESYGNITYASIVLCPDCEDDLEKYGPVSGDVKIHVLTPDRDTVGTLTKSSSFILKVDEDALERSTLSLYTADQLQRWTFQDQLKIFCELTYVKNNGVVTVSSPYYSSTIKTSDESSLSRDLEQLYVNDCFNDLTISVKGKKYPVHKAILATRSSVFNAMLRNDMQESQKNLINITDIERETFEEMLHYIYTGKTKNLHELAFELLPVADKYDLKELRIMCENVVFKKLSTDNAVKILILADMHRAEELKKGTLEFIKVNYADCEELKNADILNNLTTSRALLLKDMLDAFCKT